MVKDSERLNGRIIGRIMENWKIEKYVGFNQMDLFVIKTVSAMFYFLLNSFILVYKTALERF